MRVARLCLTDSDAGPVLDLRGKSSKVANFGQMANYQWNCKPVHMGSKLVEELLENSVGVHFSGLHVDDIEVRNSEQQLLATAETENGCREPFVIGVAGGAAAGKTAVCDMIIEKLHDQRVVLVNQVDMESFYYDLTEEELNHVHEYNFDHPDAFDTENLLCCMEKLRHGLAVDVPNYDFKSHKRKLPARKYSKFVKPAFDDFILPTKKYADIIIPRGGDNHVAIDLIVEHIRTKLGQHNLCKIYPNLSVIQSTFQIRGMHTLIRDAKTTTHDFIFYSDRLIRLVVEHGLGHLPFKEKQVITPTGSVYTGVEFCKRLCGISIIRSGESMENALRACCKGIKIGKILIHREGDNGQQLIYHNLPKDIADRNVLLLDPILGTGNSAVQAVSLLLQNGVQESNIIFLNLISAPQGVHVVCKRFPRIKIVTSEIEFGLNEDFRVVPGMGEFGDRYFGTDDD
ncbi:hypothetical protein C4D60_Mb04t17460 [Musa balbisiana]|uniref:Uncharacterized protein n=1 Tax=Musa balbisiana TaxID=52838 RepID=A0A4V4H9U1_MUSBA|nr:hypothetical protein C4D60_Mb04t17460 [Musa balbisiana]